MLEVQFAGVSWTISDVQKLVPGISDDEALELLKEGEGEVELAARLAGNKVIEILGRKEPGWQSDRMIWLSHLRSV